MLGEVRRGRTSIHVIDLGQEFARGEHYTYEVTQTYRDTNADFRPFFSQLVDGPVGELTVRVVFGPGEMPPRRRIRPFGHRGAFDYVADTNSVELRIKQPRFPETYGIEWEPAAGDRDESAEAVAREVRPSAERPSIILPRQRPSRYEFRRVSGGEAGEAGESARTSNACSRSSSATHRPLERAIDRLELSCLDPARAASSGPTFPVRILEIDPREDPLQAALLDAWGGGRPLHRAQASGQIAVLKRIRCLLLGLLLVVHAVHDDEGPGHQVGIRVSYP